MACRRSGVRIPLPPPQGRAGTSGDVPALRPCQPAIPPACSRGTCHASRSRGGAPRTRSTRSRSSARRSRWPCPRPCRSASSPPPGGAPPPVRHRDSAGRGPGDSAPCRREDAGLPVDHAERPVVALAAEHGIRGVAPPICARGCGSVSVLESLRPGPPGRGARSRGYGAVGSASAWHAEGQGFESPYLHGSSKARSTRTGPLCADRRSGRGHQRLQGAALVHQCGRSSGRAGSNAAPGSILHSWMRRIGSGSMRRPECARGCRRASNAGVLDLHAHRAPPSDPHAAPLVAGPADRPRLHEATEEPTTWPPTDSRSPRSRAS